MSDIDKVSLALEAERLLRDDTLNAALDAQLAVGFETLLDTPAEDVPAVIRAQAFIGAIKAFRGQLETYVTQGRQQNTRGSVA